MQKQKINRYQVYIHPNNQPQIDCGIIDAKNPKELKTIMRKDYKAEPSDYTFEVVSTIEGEFVNYVPPSWDELFMRKVYEIASKSKDPRSKIGAVLVKDNHAILEGYNGFPKGVTDSKERYNDKETKYKYVVHAEANSVLIAAKFGIATDGCILYTQGIPCENCTKCIIQGGIKEIVIHQQWPNLYSSKMWTESIEISKIMLSESNISVKTLNKKLNIYGYLDGKKIRV